MHPLIRVPFNYGLDIAASKGIGLSDGAPGTTAYQIYRVGSSLYWNGTELGVSGGTSWGNITGTLSSQTDLNNALAAKAPLASPSFTGTPTATTPATSDDTTTLATTAYVKANLQSVSVTYNAVVSALGFTPANKNGDTFTGGIIAPDLFINGMTKQKISIYTTAVTLSQNDNIVIMNGMTVLDVILPVGVNNYSYRIRNNGGYQCNVVRSGSDTINNTVDDFVLLPNNAINIVFYNGNWHLF